MNDINQIDLKFLVKKYFQKRDENHIMFKIEKFYSNYTTMKEEILF